VLAIRSPLLVILLATTLDVAGAGAETFKLTASDGTVHFTNAPTDPSYQRMGFTTGTAAGWLRLPQGETGPYVDEIRAAADRYGVPVKLVSAVIRAESGFNARAISRKGARGLMQLMPAAQSDMGVANVHDPRQNILGGTRYLRILANLFNGDLVLTIAAYHAGAGAVRKYGNSVPPYKNTRKYLRMVLDRYYRYRDGR
jgi:soluble lytic murein transglycosylase-like protein